MHPARRAAYLDAMGIPRWVVRERSPSPPAAETPASVQSAPPAETPSVAEGAVVAAATANAPADAAVGDLGWDALRERVAACRDCSLCETRTQTVFGVGNPDADLMIIGEAPGADEDRQGEPFVGRAGQLLTAMLQAIGLERDDVYIANILKCRPPGNRNPSGNEATACRGYLERQIQLVAPRLILSVGKVSAQNLLLSDAPVGRMRGKVHCLPAADVPVRVTYHPAYLLRQPAEKAKAWADLQQVARDLDPEGRAGA